MTNRRLLDDKTAVVDRAPSLKDQVYARLRTEIVETRWAAGQVLLEPELAALYAVSKTPVREALARLIVEGWVVTLPGKGYLVRPVRPNDISEIFGLRMMVEPPLLAEATRNAGPAGIELLRARWLRQAELVADPALSLDAARVFHLTIAERAHNERALTLLDGLTAEARRLHHMLPASHAETAARSAVAEHEAILDAMAAKDAERASALMREHLARASRSIVEAFLPSEP